MKCLKPFPNLTHNCVFSGMQNQVPIVLKISDNTANESFALEHFKSFGAVGIIEKGINFLILEKAVPGETLKSHFPNNDTKSTEIACKVIKKLTHAPLPTKHSLPHLKDWLRVLNQSQTIPNKYLQKARKLKDHLLKTAGPDMLLHGDLHHDNILKHSNEWVIIDPKGVIGETAYEVATFIRNPMPDILNVKNIEEIIQNRICIFSKELNISKDKILNWCFIHSILGWIWILEDFSDKALVKANDCDITYWQEMTEIFDNFNSSHHHE